MICTDLKKLLCLCVILSVLSCAGTKKDLPSYTCSNIDACGWILTGEISNARGDVAGAVKAYEEVVTALPDNLFKTRLAHLLLDSGQLQEAVFYLEDVFSSKEAFEHVFYAKAVYNCAVKNTLKSNEFAKRAREEEPYIMWAKSFKCLTNSTRKH